MQNPANTVNLVDMSLHPPGSDIGILSELSNFNSSHWNLSEIIGNGQNKNN